MLIASILYTILIFKTEGFDNKYAYGFIAFGIIVLFYVIYSEFYLQDPRIYPEELFKHVIAQKMIVFWIMISVYFFSLGLGKYLLSLKE